MNSATPAGSAGVFAAGVALRRPAKTAERVAEILRSRIADGVLSDGDLLPTQHQLQQEFGVGRATLREALRVLEIDGLLQIRAGSHQGARVCRPDPAMLAGPVALVLSTQGTTIGDVLETRAVVEAAMVGLLAERGSYDDFVRLAEFIDERSDAVAEAAGFSAFAAEFSTLMSDIIANPATKLVGGILVDATAKYAPPVKAARLAPADASRLKGSYTELIVLLRKRDAHGAQQHWRRHMEMVTELVTRGFRRIRPRALSS